VAAVPPISKEQTDTLTKFLEAEKYPAEFVRRLEGFLPTMNNPRAKDILLDWHKRGVLGVSDKDAKAWGDIRNPAAHGRSSDKMPTPDELQENLHGLHRVANLVNKLVLQAMGYKGKFLDYSDWETRDFPLAGPSDLFAAPDHQAVTREEPKLETEQKQDQRGQDKGPRRHPLWFVFCESLIRNTWKRWQ
jgi:hypothetical protein